MKYSIEKLEKYDGAGNVISEEITILNDVKLSSVAVFAEDLNNDYDKAAEYSISSYDAGGEYFDSKNLADFLMLKPKTAYTK